MTKSNLNDEVLIHITDKGLALLERKNNELINLNPQFSQSVKKVFRENIPKVERTISGMPFYKMQMYSVMENFGDFALNGSLDLFISMEFYYL